MDNNSDGQVVYVPPLPSPPSSMNLQPLNLKSEVDRRKTFKNWRVPFMDVNQLVAAGFFFTNRGGVVRCAFCGVEVEHWVEGDDAFKDHQRWSPSCEFLRGCLQETFLLDLKHFNNSLAMTCAGLIWSTHQKPRVLSVVNIHLLLIIYFPLCTIITVYSYLLSLTAARFRQHNALVGWPNLPVLFII